MVVISRKEGRRGKGKVSYDGCVGLCKGRKFIDMMNGEEYVELKNMGVGNG